MDIEFGKDLLEYQKHLKNTKLQDTYGKLMAYFVSLRNYFDKKYSADYTVGSLYEGRLDHTYFPIMPDSIRSKKLKFVIVFDHAKIQFDIWLLGINKEVRQEFWTKPQNEKWDKYPLLPMPDNGIIQHVMVEKPDFTNQAALSSEIDEKTMTFINDIVKDLA